MENQSMSLGDLFSFELFLGSITFLLGATLLFLLLLKLKINLKEMLLYCFLQMILAVFFSTFFLYSGVLILI